MLPRVLRSENSDGEAPRLVDLLGHVAGPRVIVGTAISSAVRMPLPSVASCLAARRRTRADLLS